MKWFILLTAFAVNGFANENLALSDCKLGNQEGRKVAEEKSEKNVENTEDSSNATKQN